MTLIASGAPPAAPPLESRSPLWSALRRWGFVAAMLPFTAGVAPALAQRPAGAAARPEYRVVRFDEDWSVLRDTTRRGIDRLKYIPLSERGDVYLSLGGQARARAEHVENFLLSDVPQNTDTFSLLRLLLHGDLHVGRYVRAFVEGKHALAFDRSLPGGRRPLDHDEWELQNAFVDVACCGDVGQRLALRVGRQELLFGSQRLVSPLDWANTRRTFDGGRLTAVGGGVVVDGFVTRPVLVRTEERNRRDDATLFWGIDARPAAPSPRLAWQAYLLTLVQDNQAGLWGYEGEHERYTLGGRVTGTLGAPANRFDLEAGWQTGSLGERDLSAWFLASDLSRSFADAPLRPSVTVGFDYSSGDGDPTDDEVGTFHQLYPLAHAYAGFMDLLGRQNLVEGRLVATANPSRVLQLRGAVHHFLQASTEDAVYSPAGTALWPGDGEAREIGTELDLTGGLRLARHLRLDAGYGLFLPGELPQRAIVDDAASHWVFLGATATF